MTVEYFNDFSRSALDKNCRLWNSKTRQKQRFTNYRPNPTLCFSRIAKTFLRERALITHALDIWSLGSPVHKMFPSETPFIELRCESEKLISGREPKSLVSWLDPEDIPVTGTGMEARRDYCHGESEFPTGLLRRAHLNDEGAEFDKSLPERSTHGSLRTAELMAHRIYEKLC